MNWALTVHDSKHHARASQRWEYGCVPVLAPDLIRPIVDYERKSKMNPTRPLVIHELLPNEIMGVIFEEHTKQEWRAPAIDGRVCRIWRQAVLNTPRAWMYLEINYDKPPRIKELREWLHRSGSAPLYIRVNKVFTLNGHLDEQPLYDMLGGCHTRIASLRLPLGDPSFFEKRDFPCLRLLDIDMWYSVNFLARPVRWDSMLELRSLRLSATRAFPVQWSELTQLEVLVLYDTTLTSFPQHSLSLATLVLDNVSVDDLISSPVTFLSLTYLSLYGVIGLKLYIDAPCLVTFHENCDSIPEPFSSPVPSLVEYGVFLPSSDDVNPAKWHRYFPNVSRLSIRAHWSVLISFLRSLSGDPHSLPALQTISARMLGASFTEEKQAIMKGLIQVRRDLMLYSETEPPFQIPLFFGQEPETPL